ncbi:MAG: hypothetical protein ACYTGL_04770 [Planctomycetota bacterium]|jgi:hypothetical protein
MQTLIIIGASNVTLSLPVIWAGLAGAESRKLRLMIAAGHGRSFALPNTVLGRTLPSILECGLWEAMDSLERERSGAEGQPAAKALITDVGNDLLYGASAEQIAEWVRECVQRLTERGIRPGVTRLPVSSLRTLSKRRFAFFRSVLFPSSTLTFESAIEQAEQLDQSLHAIAEESGLETSEPESHWYGFDPIHICRRHRPQAWAEYLSPLLPEFAPRQAGWLMQPKLWNRKAAVRWRRSREFVTPQPCLTEGESELWLF